jgi:hypothetical protein
MKTTIDRRPQLRSPAQPRPVMIHNPPTLSGLGSQLDTSFWVSTAVTVVFLAAVMTTKPRTVRFTRL